MTREEFYKKLYAQGSFNKRNNYSYDTFKNDLVGNEGFRKSVYTGLGYNKNVDYDTFEGYIGIERKFKKKEEADAFVQQRQAEKEAWKNRSGLDKSADADFNGVTGRIQKAYDGIVGMAWDAATGIIKTGSRALSLVGVDPETIDDMGLNLERLDQTAEDYKTLTSHPIDAFNELLDKNNGSYIDAFLDNGDGKGQAYPKAENAAKEMKAAVSPAYELRLADAINDPMKFARNLPGFLVEQGGQMAMGAQTGFTSYFFSTMGQTESDWRKMAKERPELKLEEKPLLGAAYTTSMATIEALMEKLGMEAIVGKGVTKKLSKYVLDKAVKYAIASGEKVTTSVLEKAVTEIGKKITTKTGKAAINAAIGFMAEGTEEGLTTLGQDAAKLAVNWGLRNGGNDGADLFDQKEMLQTLPYRVAESTVLGGIAGAGFGGGRGFLHNTSDYIAGSYSGELETKEDAAAVKDKIANEITSSTMYDDATKRALLGYNDVMHDSYNSVPKDATPETKKDILSLIAQKKYVLNEIQNAEIERDSLDETLRDDKNAGIETKNAQLEHINASIKAKNRGEDISYSEEGGTYYRSIGDEKQAIPEVEYFVGRHIMDKYKPVGDSAVDSAPEDKSFGDQLSTEEIATRGEEAITSLTGKPTVVIPARDNDVVQKYFSEDEKDAYDKADDAEKKQLVKNKREEILANSKPKKATPVVENATEITTDTTAETSSNVAAETLSEPTVGTTDTSSQSDISNSEARSLDPDKEYTYKNETVKVSKPIRNKAGNIVGAKIVRSNGETDTIVNEEDNDADFIAQFLDRNKTAELVGDVPNQAGDNSKNYVDVSYAKKGQKKKDRYRVTDTNVVTLADGSKVDIDAKDASAIQGLAMQARDRRKKKFDTQQEAIKAKEAAVEKKKEEKSTPDPKTEPVAKKTTETKTEVESAAPKQKRRGKNVTEEKSTVPDLKTVKVKEKGLDEMSKDELVSVRKKLREKLVDVRDAERTGSVPTISSKVVKEDYDGVDNFIKTKFPEEVPKSDTSKGESKPATRKTPTVDIKLDTPVKESVATDEQAADAEDKAILAFKPKRRKRKEIVPAAIGSTIEEKKANATPEQLEDIQDYEDYIKHVTSSQPFKPSNVERARIEELRKKYGKFYSRQPIIEEVRSVEEPEIKRTALKPVSEYGTKGDILQDALELSVKDYEGDLPESLSSIVNNPKRMSARKIDASDIEKALKGKGIIITNTLASRILKMYMLKEHEYNKIQKINGSSEKGEGNGKIRGDGKEGKTNDGRGVVERDEKGVGNSRAVEEQSVDVGQDAGKVEPDEASNKQQAKEKKPVADSEVVPVSSESVQDDKRAAAVEDIERRRQEELDKIATNIFPNTKVKDIVYHGTIHDFEKFNKGINVGFLQESGVYFTNKYDAAKNWALNFDKEKARVIPVVLNIQASDIYSSKTKSENGMTFQDKVLELKEENPDSIIFDNKDEILVFDTNQIHILSQEELSNIDKINAKYDAELAALENTKPVSDKKADIERRRQEELSKFGTSGKKTSKNYIKVLGTDEFVSRDLMELAYSNDNGNNPEIGGGGQTLDRIIERGGYSKEELLQLLKPEIAKINAEYDAEYVDAVKKGVTELFESTPELANAVYEALGFKEKYKGAEKGDLINELKQITDPYLKEFADLFIQSNVNIPLYYSKGNDYAYVVPDNTLIISKGSTGIIKQKSIIHEVLHGGTSNNLLSNSDFKNRIESIINNIKKSDQQGRITFSYELQSADEFISALADKAFGNYLKQKGLFDEVFTIVKDNIIFEKGFKITTQQKQQAQQLYAQYLSQNPNGSIEGFKAWKAKYDAEIKELENKPTISKEQQPIDVSKEEGSGVVGEVEVPKTLSELKLSDETTQTLENKLKELELERTNKLIENKGRGRFDDRLKDEIDEVKRKIYQRENELASRRNSDLESKIKDGSLLKLIAKNKITAEDARGLIIESGMEVPSEIQSIVDKNKQDKKENKQSIIERDTDFLGNEKEAYMVNNDKANGIRTQEDIEYFKSNVKRAIDNGKYQKAIADGKMTANDAKIIIESYGLKVPKEIESLLSKEQTPSQSEIETQKADIERRRQEELKKFETSEVKTEFYNIPVFLDSNAKVRGDKQEYISREVFDLAYANDNREGAGFQTAETLIRRGGYTKGELTKGPQALLKPEIDKINAKYDAELAELSKTQSNTPNVNVTFKSINEISDLRDRDAVSDEDLSAYRKFLSDKIDEKEAKRDDIPRSDPRRELENQSIRKFDTLLNAIKDEQGRRRINGPKNQIATTPLLAPNGKPSNLTTEQHAMVRTPEFKAWFGDWENDPDNSSKVVDDNGEPLVVYHGTTNYGFDEFNENKPIYFTDNKDVADTYQEKSVGESKGTYAAFLNIKNIEKVDANNSSFSSIEVDENRMTPKKSKLSVAGIYESIFGYRFPSILTTKEGNGKTNGVLVQNVRDNILGNTNTVPSDVYIVVSSNQIKSTDNTGSFNPASNNIRNQIAAEATGFQTRDGNPIGFTYDTDKVARERFDIPNLKKIGQGSDRTVFDLGDGRVLKVAHSARGLEQNIHEGDFYLSHILPEVFERGLNYVVVENTPRLKSSDIVTTYDPETDEEVGTATAGQMIADLKKFSQTDFERRGSEFQDVLGKYGFKDIMDYDVLYGDFNAIRNWGYKDGTPMHLDGGTFGGVRMLENYKKKWGDLSDPEFRDIYYKSQAAKKEFGDTDKFTKFQIESKATPQSASTTATNAAQEALDSGINEERARIVVDLTNEGKDERSTLKAFSKTWLQAMERSPENSAFREKGLELIKDTPYFEENGKDAVKALEAAIADNAAKLKEFPRPRFTSWLKNFWQKVGQMLKINIDPADLRSMKLQDYLDIASGHLIYSNQIYRDLVSEEVQERENLSNEDASIVDDMPDFGDDMDAKYDYLNTEIPSVFAPSETERPDTQGPATKISEVVGRDKKNSESITISPTDKNNNKLLALVDQLPNNSQKKQVVESLILLAPTLKELGVSVVVHTSQDSFFNSSIKEGNSETITSLSNGFYSPDSNTIHINLQKKGLRANVAVHETVHPIITELLTSNPDTFKGFVDDIMADPELRKLYYDSFARNYYEFGVDIVKEELVTEAASSIIMERILRNLDKADDTLIQRVLNYILNALGSKYGQLATAINTRDGFVAYANSLADAISQGMAVPVSQEVRDNIEDVRNKLSVDAKRHVLSYDRKAEMIQRTDNLTAARTLEEKGVSNEDIRLATGWDNKDGKKTYNPVRTKAKSRLRIDNNISAPQKGLHGNTTTLGDIISDNDIFKKYPQIKDIPVTTQAGQNSGGFLFTKEDGSIGMVLEVGNRPADNANPAIDRLLQKAVQAEMNMIQPILQSDVYSVVGNEYDKDGTIDEVRDYIKERHGLDNEGADAFINYRYAQLAGDQVAVHTDFSQGQYFDDVNDIDMAPIRSEIKYSLDPSQDPAKRNARDFLMASLRKDSIAHPDANWQGITSRMVSSKHITQSDADEIMWAINFAKRGKTLDERKALVMDAEELTQRNKKTSLSNTAIKNEAIQKYIDGVNDAFADQNNYDSDGNIKPLYSNGYIKTTDKELRDNIIQEGSAHPEYVLEDLIEMNRQKKSGEEITVRSIIAMDELKRSIAINDIIYQSTNNPDIRNDIGRKIDALKHTLGMIAAAYQENGSYAGRILGLRSRIMQLEGISYQSVLSRAEKIDKDGDNVGLSQEDKDKLKEAADIIQANEARISLAFEAKKKKNQTKKEKIGDQILKKTNFKSEIDPTKSIDEIKAIYQAMKQGGSSSNVKNAIDPARIPEYLALNTLIDYFHQNKVSGFRKIVEAVKTVDPSITQDDVYDALIYRGDVAIDGQDIVETEERRKETLAHARAIRKLERLLTEIAESGSSDPVSERSNINPVNDVKRLLDAIRKNIFRMVNDPALRETWENNLSALEKSYDLSALTDNNNDTNINRLILNIRNLKRSGMLAWAEKEAHKLDQKLEQIKTRPGIEAMLELESDAVQTIPDKELSRLLQQNKDKSREINGVLDKYRKKTAIAQVGAIWKQLRATIGSSLAMIDLSAVGVQGFAATVSNLYQPRVVGKAFKEMFKAIGNSGYANVMYKNITDDVEYEDMMSHKLNLHNPNGTIHVLEQYGEDDWFDKAYYKAKDSKYWLARNVVSKPLQIRRWLKEKSDATFSTYLNALSFYLYKSYTASRTDKASGVSMASSDEKAIVARGINNATGRPKFDRSGEQFISSATNVLWAPRLYTSQIFNPANIVIDPLKAIYYTSKGNKEKGIAYRHRAKQSMALAVFGGALFYAHYLAAMLKCGHASIGTDHESSEYLKINCDGIVIDVSGNMVQYARMARNLYQTIVEGKDLGETPYTVGTYGVLGKWLQYHLSPHISSSIQIATGKDFRGKRYDETSMAKSRYEAAKNALIPIWTGSTYDFMFNAPEIDASTKAVLSAEGLLGIGVRYTSAKEKEKQEANNVIRKAREKEERKQDKKAEAEAGKQEVIEKYGSIPVELQGEWDTPSGTVDPSEFEPTEKYFRDKKGRYKVFKDLELTGNQKNQYFVVKKRGRRSKKAGLKYKDPVTDKEFSVL